MDPVSETANHFVYTGSGRWHDLHQGHTFSIIISSVGRRVKVEAAVIVWHDAQISVVVPLNRGFGIVAFVGLVGFGGDFGVDLGAICRGNHYD